MTGSKGSLWGAIGLGCLILPMGCGSLMVKRDMSATKPGTVVYDDLCGLQDYFDGMKDSTIATPREVFAQDLLSDENGQAVGGSARFRYDTDFQLHHVRKLLTSNWANVPEAVGNAPAVELEVRWSKRAGVKRVITEEAAALIVANKRWELPYQACLSDFVFGEDLYNTRRVVLQLPPPPRSPFSKRAAEKAAAPVQMAVAAPAAAPVAPAATTPAPATAPAAPGSVTPAPAAELVPPPAPSVEPPAAPAPTH